MFTTANQPKSEVNWVIEWKSEGKVTVRPGQILGAFAAAILFVFVILALGWIKWTRMKRGETFSLQIFPLQNI